MCCYTYYAPDSELTTVCSFWRWTTLSVPWRFQTSPWDATFFDILCNGAPGQVANWSRAAPRSWHANPVVPNSDRELRCSCPKLHRKIRWLLSRFGLVLLLCLLLCLLRLLVYIVLYDIIPSIFRNLIFTSSLSFPLHAVLRTMELKGHGVVVGTICCREVTSTNPFKLAMVGHGWPWYPWLEWHHGRVFPCFFVGCLCFSRRKFHKNVLTVCWFLLPSRCKSRPEIGPEVDPCNRVMQEMQEFCWVFHQSQLLPF